MVGPSEYWADLAEASPLLGYEAGSFRPSHHQSSIILSLQHHTQEQSCRKRPQVSYRRIHTL
jgi:hypothetical protein